MEVREMSFTNESALFMGLVAIVAVIFALIDIRKNEGRNVGVLMVLTLATTVISFQLYRLAEIVAKIVPQLPTH
jgi:hypothetical protein